MVSLDVIRNVAGIAGTVISSGLFLSAAPTFWKIIRKKSVEKYSSDPYLVTLFISTLWAFYGLPFVRPNSMLVFTVNGIGILIEAIYLIIFFALAHNKERMRILRVLGIEAVLMVALVLGVLLGANTLCVRSNIVGFFCVSVSTAMFAAPLTVMRKVVETKSVEYMPFSLSLVGLLNATYWTAYALINFDINIFIINGLGCVCSLVQLILYLCYYNSNPKKEKHVELPTVRPKPNNTINGSNISIAVEQQEENIALLNDGIGSIFLLMGESWN